MKKQEINCETCGHYCYDEDHDVYYCEVDLDEDDMGRFLARQTHSCPYYWFGDEYTIVRKQN